jgi:tripartite-type tricarboxylate transporter receptor subunit TctC
MMRVVFVFLLAVLSAGAAAQRDYPNRPIRVVIQFAPGGSDVVARILTHKMAESLGQSFVIDNRPGAAGVIASGIVAKAAPDGYTLLFSTASFAVTAVYERNLPYDSVKDFDAVHAGVASRGSGVFGQGVRGTCQGKAHGLRLDRRGRYRPSDA